MYGKGYGMPSSHAQFVAYFAVYFSLFMLKRLQTTPNSSRVKGFEDSWSLSPLLRLIIALMAVILAAAVAASRIYLSYHTPIQVVVGIVAGASSAALWFNVITVLRHYGWSDYLLDLSVFRWGRWRDLVVQEDFAQAGWIRWHMQRSAKKTS